MSTVVEFCGCPHSEALTAEVTRLTQERDAQAQAADKLRAERDEARGALRWALGRVDALTPPCPACDEDLSGMDCTCTPSAEETAARRALAPQPEAPAPTTGMRRCEPCQGPGPCLWDPRSGVYACSGCHSDPADAFFAREAQPEAPACQCGSGAHPRRCVVHPERYQQHCDELSAENAPEAPAVVTEPADNEWRACLEVLATKLRQHGYTVAAPTPDGQGAPK